MSDGGQCRLTEDCYNCVIFGLRAAVVERKVMYAEVSCVPSSPVIKAGTKRGTRFNCRQQNLTIIGNVKIGSANPARGRRGP
jgi:hypothetical protein